jgi:hypothetical protein
MRCLAWSVAAVAMLLGPGVAWGAAPKAPPKGGMPIQKVWPGRETRYLTPPAILRGPTEKQRTPAPYADKLDLNHASLEQLQRLPGVGVVWAPKLLSGRPYYTEGDLARDGIPFNVIEQIAPLITLE